MSSLAGRSVLVTRPAEDTARLAAALAALDAVPLAAPMLTIRPVPLLPAAAPAVRALLEAADGYVFVSQNAARCGLAQLQELGLDAAAKSLFAVGPATAAVLAAAGLAASVPATDHSSAGLLALPALAASRVRGRAVAIFRGRGGRESLARGLRARGASVSYVECYRREPNPLSLRELLHSAAISVPDIAVVTSVAILRALADAIRREDLDALLAMPVVVPGARIAACVAAAGFTETPLVIENPSDASIIDALTKWASSKS